LCSADARAGHGRRQNGRPHDRDRRRVQFKRTAPPLISKPSVNGPLAAVGRSPGKGERNGTAFNKRHLNC
jgi:hypothetical protein